jgi:hypothetical protein
MASVVEEPQTSPIVGRVATILGYWHLACSWSLSDARTMIGGSQDFFRRRERTHAWAASLL